MCIKSGKRCEICNDPVRTRARQNISNRISSIADKNQEILESSAQSYEAINNSASEESKAIACSDEYLTSFKDEVTVFRNERTTYANDRDWVLAGKPDTPENYAAGLEDRGRKIVAMGEVIEARSEFLLPDDYQERLDAYEEKLNYVKDKVENFRNPAEVKAKAMQSEFKAKLGKGDDDLSYRNEITDEEKSELLALEDKANAARRDNFLLKIALNHLNKFEDDESRYLQDARIAANMQALAEIRTIGGEYVTFEQQENISYGHDELKTVIADDATQQAVQNAIQEVYPKEWLEYVNATKRLAIETHSTPTDAFYHVSPNPKQPYTHTTKPFDGIEDDDRYEGWNTAYDDTDRDTGMIIGLPRQHEFYNEGDPVDTENGWRKGKMIDDIWGGENDIILRDEPNPLKYATYSKEGVGYMVIPKATDTKYGDSSRIYVHEFGHHIQNSIPAIHHMENWWAEKRTTLADGSREQLKKLPSGEFYREDQFTHWYMGREYKTGVLSTTTSFKEVFTVGTESLFKGSYGGLDGFGVDTPISATVMTRSDKDMKRLIFGIYAGI